MDKDLRQIHEASMKILEQTGMKIHHPKAIEILKKNNIKVCKDTVFFTENQLMEWVSKAPSSFNIYARNPKYDMTIGGDNVECAPGYGAPLILDADGEKRPALVKDFKTFVKLFHQSDYFKINGGIVVQPKDLPSESTLAMMLYSTLNYTDKCIMTGSGNGKEVEELMDMLGIVFDGKEKLAEKPRAITIVNTNSPLYLDNNAAETLMVYAKYGQPMVVASCTMAGTTGPVTLAGTIALTNAEVLCGIALAQMVREGTPVLYGSQTTTSDMKSGSIAIGSPEGSLCYEYAARLAKAYGIPCRGGGTISDAKTVSAQSGYESMMTCLVCHQNKMNYIIHSAGIMDSFGCMSYEKFIVDLEIIGMVKRYLDKVAINEDTLALDLINNIGPAGQFITAPHTLKHCRKEPFLPDISIRGSVSGDPNEKLLHNINKKKKSMLDKYQKPELPDDIQKQLKQYLVEKGVDIQLIESI